LQLTTSRRGTTLSARIFPSPYTSFRNRFSAVIRWASPRSTRSHSAALTIRGSTSYGKIFSVASPWPYTVKVMPRSRNVWSAARCRCASSSDDSSCSRWCSIRYASRGAMPDWNISSYAPPSSYASNRGVGTGGAEAMSLERRFSLSVTAGIYPTDRTLSTHRA
jgi:hypothetical protein